MPGMDGLQAAAAIRGEDRGTGRHLPVIALTARAGDADREACPKAGMDAFPTKSIEPVPLAAAIRVFLHEAACAAVP